MPTERAWPDARRLVRDFGDEFVLEGLPFEMEGTTDTECPPGLPIDGPGDTRGTTVGSAGTSGSLIVPWSTSRCPWRRWVESATGVSWRPVGRCGHGFGDEGVEHVEERGAVCSSSPLAHQTEPAR